MSLFSDVMSRQDKINDELIKATAKGNKGFDSFSGKLSTGTSYDGEYKYARTAAMIVNKVMGRG